MNIMSKEKVEELKKLFNSVDYIDLVGAIISFEKGIENIYTLETIYDDYMNSKTINGLFSDELDDLVESYRESE